MFRCFLSLVLLVAPVPVLMAQASLQCQTRPVSLSAMRHCFRPLLVFSPSSTDARLKRQSRILDAAADDMMDRFVMFTPILPGRRGFVTPLDAPYVVLSEHAMRAIRERFRVPRDRFEVLLLDEDGRVRLRSRRPIDITHLNQLIDSWPQRQIERTRRGAN